MSRSKKINDSDVIAGDVWLNVHGEMEQCQVRFLDRTSVWDFQNIGTCSELSMTV